MRGLFAFLVERATAQEEHERRSGRRIEELAEAQATQAAAINSLTPETPRGPLSGNGEQMQRQESDLGERSEQADPELQALKQTLAQATAELRTVQSQIHRVTSSAPEVHKVIEETQRTPFSGLIVGTSIPNIKLKLAPYEGKTDPRAHMTAFCIAMGRTKFASDVKDAAYCQLFVENLAGAALNWFSRLKPGSISNFNELSAVFIKHYSMYIEKGASDADLWTMTQGKDETLRAFLSRFKAVISNVVVTDEAGVAALRNALWYDSRLREDLMLNRPSSLEDALHRASRYVQIEDERRAYAEKHASTSKGATKDKPKGDGETRRPYTGPRSDRAAARQRTFQITSLPSSNRAPGTSSGYRSRPNTWTRSSGAGTSSKYCEYHGTAGHSTEECYGFKKYLFDKYKEEELARKSDEARQHGDMDPPKRDREADASGRTQPPKARKRVAMIMGPSPFFSDTVRSIKSYSRQIGSATELVNLTEENDTVIEFSEWKSRDVVRPHNDALVLELMIGDCEIARALVDPGSSVNVIYKETLDKMEIPDTRVKKSKQPLTAFNGATTMSVGTIKLDTYLGGVQMEAKFTVIEAPDIYNVILGTPWIHSMRAVPSTYHQCIKFPSERGIVTIRGSQRTARLCYVNENRLRRSQVLQIRVPEGAEENVDQVETTSPQLGKIRQVCIDPGNPDRCVGVGAGLEKDIFKELVTFLRENRHTFAWSVEDMPGISLDVTFHELNVDPTFKPVRQKRRKLGPERAAAVNAEVERLLKAGSVIEVKYPDWLANPVVVKKKNGKWRVCVDFTDLNKACPKDSFPLPHIDRLVESTAGNQLLSFLDAFSGYNQILMHPEDRDKTAFMTDRGLYCYKVMPFGLKNAGATYQRLVNKMFSEQLGRTMEVYIDDMLVKSLREGDHVMHLKECFGVLNKYGMKLNPTKCTFAVTSGEFLGYLVTQRGIEANPKQLSAVINMKSPETVRDVQRLTGRVAALSRFISRSTDKCLPFYQKLRSNKKFEWNDSCEKAFQQLKEYLTTPPILSKPEAGEMLYLYIAVSKVAVSGVLVREEAREQRPIFYVSKSLAAPETRYMMTEKLALAVVVSARKLRPYFQSHSVTVLSSHPLRTILHSPTQSGRLARWAIELSEYDIEYKPRTALKAQVLADFVVEVTPELSSGEEGGQLWILHVDGSSSAKGSGLGVRLTSPTGEILEQSIRLQFPASNNEAEYEALLAGLRLARSVQARRLRVHCDSQLVANQYSGSYEARDARMTAYLRLVQEAAAEFEEFKLEKVPRGDNAAADALASLASASEDHLKRVIPVETLETPSIASAVAARKAEGLPTKHVLALHEDDLGDDVGPGALAGIGEGPDWRDEIRGYIADGAVPEDKWQARKLKQRCARYSMHKDHVYRQGASGILLYCIHGEDVRRVIQEVHSGVNGNHAGGRLLAQKIRKQGYYWPTMDKDCRSYAQKCERCQRHAPIIHQPTELMKLVSTPYPFMRWAMDIVGPLHKSDKKEYLLVLTDYFSKWVEAEAYAKVTSANVINFLWKNVLCRHGVPYAIVTDNGPQFTSAEFEHFCAVYKIKIQYSTPHNPQGNGQAEATNRRIVEGLKKRLTAKKGSWSFELDGVLWAHRTTPRQGTQQSPYSMVYGVEAVIPAEVRVPTLRRQVLPENEAFNDELLRDNLDTIEEQRELANIRLQAYQNQIARYYNRNVNPRAFQEGDLVLRRVVQNTSEYRAGKLGATWEGPYSITKVIHPGVYELARMDGILEPRPWNSVNLKKYYY